MKEKRKKQDKNKTHFLHAIREEKDPIRFACRSLYQTPIMVMILFNSPQGDASIDGINAYNIIMFIPFDFNFFFL